MQMSKYRSCIIKNLLTNCTLLLPNLSPRCTRIVLRPTFEMKMLKNTVHLT